MMNPRGHFGWIWQFSTSAGLQTYFLYHNLQIKKDCFPNVFFYVCQVGLCTLDISDLAPCVFSYCKRKLSKHQTILNLFSLWWTLFVVPRVIWSQGCLIWATVCSRASWVLRIFWCWPNRKVIEANSRPQRDFASRRWVWRVKRGHTDPLTPCQWFTVDVHTSHSLTPSPLDLLPSFPRWWRVLSISVSSAIYSLTISL